jgi:AraC-like DNA-binding protein
MHGTSHGRQVCGSIKGDESTLGLGNLETHSQGLQVWIAENLHNDLSVPKLADRASMSVRNFQRVFTRELGKTPSQCALQMRAEAARRLLERTDHGLKQIAAACRFGSADSMRRAFLRSLGTTPQKFRRRNFRADHLRVHLDMLNLRSLIFQPKIRPLLLVQPILAFDSTPYAPYSCPHFPRGNPACSSVCFT